MPKKFTDLPELTAPEGIDLLAIVDSSGNSSKKITLATLLSYIIPVGIIQSYSGATAPEGFLICDGSAVSRTTYANLFAAIGTNYGVGDGSTTFNLPNGKGRVLTGLDTAQTEFNALGKTGGAKTVNTAHTHTVASHTHGAAGATTGGDSVNHTHGTLSAGAGASATTGFSVAHGHSYNDRSGASAPGTDSQGTTSDIIQPYLTVNYIIKV